MNKSCKEPTTPLASPETARIAYLHSTIHLTETHNHSVHLSNVEPVFSKGMTLFAFVYLHR